MIIAACHRSVSAHELSALARGVDRNDLLVLAEYHGVGSTLSDRLHQLDVSSTSPLSRAPRDAAGGAGQAARCAAGSRGYFVGVLDVPFLVVKGPVLSSHWYGDDQVREFGDLDVLVRPTDFGRAVDALGAEGAVPRATNWHGFRSLGVAEIPLALGATTIDLHWDLVALGEVRRHLRLPVRELFDDSVEVRVGELDVRTLSPVDTLLHLCINAGLDGAHRLRSLVDIDTVIGSGRSTSMSSLHVLTVPERGGSAPLYCNERLRVLGTELPAGFVASVVAVSFLARREPCRR